MRAAQVRVGVWCEKLSVLGGAERHGFALLEPLLGLHAIDVIARSPSFDVTRIEDRFGIRLEPVRFVCNPRLTPWDVSRLTKAYDLFINITWASLVPSHARKSILLVFFPTRTDDTGKSSLWRSMDQRVARGQHRLLKRLAEADDRLLGSSFQVQLADLGLFGVTRRLPLLALRKLATLRDPDRYRFAKGNVSTYTTVLANSRYTAGWVERFYGRVAEISYPPIDVARFVPGPKEKLVLSVGRFEPEPQGKKHHLLIRTFRELYDLGVLRGWRMVVCGGSVPGKPNGLHQVRREAEDYPVSVEVDASFHRLRELYGRASMYWHAKGYGRDPQRDPSHYEHFGMTTVEAMAAGCIPLVINGGGQPEIITHRVDGLLWNTLGELKEQVKSFVATEERSIAAMRQAAQLRASHFSEAACRERSREIYHRLGVEHH